MSWTWSLWTWLRHCGGGRGADRVGGPVVQDLMWVSRDHPATGFDAYLPD
ncbi:hypothetical protein ACFY12_08495 [Streptomyces sp. NPDC001339]